MPTSDYLLRDARAADLPALWAVRYAVTENTLTPGRIGDAELLAAIERDGHGWVAERDGQVVGFAIGLHSGQVWALFVRPEDQGRGIGAALHARLLRWYAAQPVARLWLSTGSQTRARGFYEARGWQCVGAYGDREVRLERDNAVPARGPAETAFDRALPVRSGATVLRRLRPQDLDRLHAYRADPAVAALQGFSPMTREEAARFLGEMIDLHGLQPGGWVQLGVAAADSAEPVGDVLVGDVGLYLSPDRREAEVGFTLHPQACGRGHATQALGLALDLLFACEGVTAVHANTDARNLAAQRVLARCGFVPTGQRTAEYKGEVCTDLLYIATRDRPGLAAAG